MEQFFFGAWKSFFLGMRRFRFLLEASQETVTFAFNLFLCYGLFISF